MSLAALNGVEVEFDTIRETPVVRRALALLVARVVRSSWGGDHSLFVGQVEYARYGEGERCRWQFEFEADAFLHHMIRNLMGCLVVVGQGFQPPEWILQVLAARDRKAAAPTFSPDGLYFMGPVYPAHWGLPDRTPAYDWLP